MNLDHGGKSGAFVAVLCTFVFTLTMAFSVQTCHTRESSKDEREAVRRESLEIVSRFLSSAARRDSLTLAKVSSESVVAEVLKLHRVSAAEYLQAAASQYKPQDATVTTYEDGADVLFRYIHNTQEHQAGVRIRKIGTRLWVESFGLDVVID